MLLIKATDYRGGGAETVNTLVCPPSGRSWGSSSLTSVPGANEPADNVPTSRHAGPGTAAGPGRLGDPPGPTWAEHPGTTGQAALCPGPCHFSPSPLLHTSSEGSAGSVLPSW